MDSTSHNFKHASLDSVVSLYTKLDTLPEYHPKTFVFWLNSMERTLSSCCFDCWTGWCMGVEMNMSSWFLEADEITVDASVRLHTSSELSRLLLESIAFHRQTEWSRDPVMACVFDIHLQQNMMSSCPFNRPSGDNDGAEYIPIWHGFDPPASNAVASVFTAYSINYIMMQILRPKACTPPHFIHGASSCPIVGIEICLPDFMSTTTIWIRFE